MIKGTIDVRPALNYLEETKFRVIEAVELGMHEAMDELAIAASANAPRLTGALASKIATSARVIRTRNFIKGTVSAYKDGRPVGLWIEDGVSIPAIDASKLLVFIGRDGAPVFTRGHRAFKIPARPFMNPTLQERKAAIVETIAARIKGAIK